MLKYNNLFIQSNQNTYVCMCMYHFLHCIFCQFFSQYVLPWVFQNTYVKEHSDTTQTLWLQKTFPLNYFSAAFYD